MVNMMIKYGILGYPTFSQSHMSICNHKYLDSGNLICMTITTILIICMNMIVSISREI